jgi:hypothetical protein
MECKWKKTYSSRAVDSWLDHWILGLTYNSGTEKTLALGLRQNVMWWHSGCFVYSAKQNVKVTKKDDKWKNME